MAADNTGWKMFLVKHPAGEFIGIARTRESAEAHFGTIATLTEIGEKEIVDRRAEGKPEYVVIAP